MERIDRYIKKNHQWIIGVVIGIIIGLVPLFVNYLNTEPHTSTFFYVGRYDKEIDNLSIGDCWVRSLSSFRSDAYRCTVDHWIMDPCFLSLENSLVLDCPRNPQRGSDYIRVEPETLPDQERYLEEFENNQMPWLIKLSDGTECRYITGASLVIADMRMDYFCEEGEHIESLLLPIKTNGGQFSIGCLNDEMMSFCEIKEAWY